MNVKFHPLTPTVERRDSNSSLNTGLFALGAPTMSEHLNRKPIRNGLFNREYMNGHSATV